MHVPMCSLLQRLAPIPLLPLEALLTLCVLCSGVAVCLVGTRVGGCVLPTKAAAGGLQSLGRARCLFLPLVFLLIARPPRSFSLNYALGSAVLAVKRWLEL